MIKLEFRAEPPRYNCYIVVPGTTILFGSLPLVLVEHSLEERDTWVAQMRRAFVLFCKQIGINDIPDSAWFKHDYGKDGPVNPVDIPKDKKH